jgi:hypothetical protein
VSRLRKQQIIPEDTFIRATLLDPKINHGKFTRQVETVVKVTEGGENNEYKGTTFKTWFNFGQDKETKEEYVAYQGPLYQLLSMVAPNLDEVLDDDLTEAKYQKFLKTTVKKLDDLEIVARVGVKTAKNDPTKKSNILQPGTFGKDEGFEELDMGEKAAS